jgi:hypothetical protein
MNEKKLHELFLPLFQKNKKKSKKNSNEKNEKNVKNDKNQYINKLNNDDDDSDEEKFNENIEDNDENDIKKQTNKSDKFQMRQLLGLISPSKKSSKNLDLLPEETGPLKRGSLDSKDKNPDISGDNNKKKLSFSKLLSIESNESENVSEAVDRFSITNLNEDVKNPPEKHENSENENLKNENLKVEIKNSVQLDLDLNNDIYIEDICEYILSTPVLNEFIETQIRYIMYQLIVISNKCSI